VRNTSEGSFDFISEGVRVGGWLMAFGSWLLALGFWLLARIDLSSTIIFQYILSSLLLLTLLLFFMALAVGPAERGLLARIDLCSIFIDSS